MNGAEFGIRILLSALASACVCGALLLVLLRSGLAWRLATDFPNDRSLHVRPTPRVGGLGIVPAVVVLTFVLAPTLWVLAVIVSLLAALSQIDDRRGLPARVRFAAHVSAVAALIFIYPADVPWWLLAGTALMLVWTVNLYNFMDGADGLAGGMALFGFSGYAIAAMLPAQPDYALATVSALVGGACGAFLFFNFHPARIFLGDAGSIPLGYLAGALGYWGWRQGVWPVWFPAVVFAPFIGDTSVTLLKRLARGEKFWHAHREHYYQRMVRSGFGHSLTARVWYAVMTLGVVLGILALRVTPWYQWLAVAGWGAALALAGFVIDVHWRRYQSRPAQNQGSESK